MGFLEITEGFNRGKVIRLGPQTTIGRSPVNEICLPDSRASRQHCVIQEQSGQFIISDMGSANGTFLNRNLLPKQTPQILSPGDEITVCATRLAFHLEDPSAKVAPSAPTDPQGFQPLEEGLNFIMDEEKDPSVNMTLDASMNLLALSEKERESETGLMEAVKRLQAMVKVSADLSGISDRLRMLNKIMESIFDIFPHGERAFIMDRAGLDAMRPTVSRHSNLSHDNDEFKVSKTIINTVIENRQSVLSSDALQDFGAQMSIAELKINSMMCVPLLVRDEIIGVIGVDTSSMINKFTPDDLTMLTGIASQAAIGLNNVELYSEVEAESQKRANLSRYLSPDVVEGVLDGSIPLELGGKKTRGTILFCDIIGFTSMSESMTAEQVIEKLNRYFNITVNIVTHFKGTVHKFGGDAIMAFWNVMFDDPRAEFNAVKASLKMQSAVWTFDLDLEEEGAAPIFLGVGVNTGEFAAGNIGSEANMEYTVIGDNVNLTQRIESLAGRWRVFISESTYEPLRGDVIAIEMPPVEVKGKAKPVTVYSIRGIREANRITLCVPVVLKDEEENRRGEGMLVSCEGTDADISLLLHTRVPVGTDEILQIEFDASEISHSMTMKAHAKRVETDTHYGKAEFSKVILGDIEANDDIFSFFKPGAQFSTTTDWSHITRQ